MLKKLIWAATAFFWVYPVSVQATSHVPLWEIQSVDTMKYSRDLAREKSADPEFDQVIDLQVRKIAETGATHVGISTPYDEEFIPFLNRWVNTARIYSLNVWFRGNFAGWENWFGYPDISRARHLELTGKFIRDHPYIFAPGDIFTPCPECENGGPGDPRFTGDTSGHRRFLQDLYSASSQAFAEIGKDVKTGYFSTNGDVAKLIYDRDFTASVGGVVVIDHYVKTADKLISDIDYLASQSGGRIVLGEFGAPIPDIHGPLTPLQQSAWLQEILAKLATSPHVIGLNYWTSFGSSTSLWGQDGSSRPAVSTLTYFYNPPVLELMVKNALGQSLNTASVTHRDRTFTADSQGRLRLPLLDPGTQITVTAPGYRPHGLLAGPETYQLDIVLVKTRENPLFKLQKLTYRLLHAIVP